MKDILDVVLSFKGH